jgi:2-polyprenyl-3-methyl-5-hydroxy-6-metoxy-1,4-benzoquinol methylase
LENRQATTAERHGGEVAAGERFKFGENWTRFLKLLNDDRIRAAETSLSAWFGFPLAGKSFVDVGSGSGLFSLAARRLGATVHSFDYDPQSVACTAELKKRYFPDDPLWKVEIGSALDPEYIRSLGHFEVVYSWGVLHHTGAMWQALDQAGKLVGEGGTLFIAIYNNQGKRSVRWTKIKRFYNRSSRPVRFLLALAVCWQHWWRPCLKDLLLLRPFKSWREAGSSRGMSAWRNVIDWVGGYPFEVAKPEEIFDFFRERGFLLQRMRTEGGDLGCNEFIFTKSLTERTAVL